MKVCGALAGTVSYRLYKVPSSQFIVQPCLKPLRLSNKDNPAVLLQSGIVYDAVHVRVIIGFNLVETLESDRTFRWKLLSSTFKLRLIILHMIWF